MKKIIILSTLIAVAISCASIVSKSSWPVSISSSPSGATVVVKNKYGIEIHKSVTPTTLMLSSKNGYFSPAEYSIHYEKEGYFPGTATLSASMNGWYIGNILFGGIIGFLIVDPATGAMWSLDDVMFLTLAENPEFKKIIQNQSNINLPFEKAPTGKAPNTEDLKDILKQLKALEEQKKDNMISDDDYEAQKKTLLEKS